MSNSIHKFYFKAAPFSTAMNSKLFNENYTFRRKKKPEKKTRSITKLCALEGANSISSIKHASRLLFVYVRVFSCAPFFPTADCWHFFWHYFTFHDTRINFVLYDDLCLSSVVLASHFTFDIDITNGNFHLPFSTLFILIPSNKTKEKKIDPQMEHTHTKWINEWNFNFFFLISTRFANFRVFFSVLVKNVS